MITKQGLKKKERKIVKENKDERISPWRQSRCRGHEGLRG